MLIRPLVHRRSSGTSYPQPTLDVHVHIVKPKRIRRQRSNERHVLEIPWAIAAIAIRITGARIVAPGIAGIGTGSCGVLPFGLCANPVLLASQLREPGYVLLGITPGRVDHRHLATSPMVLDWLAASRGNASIPLFECHFELGNGERPRERHLVLWTFAGLPVELVFRRAHNEPASRDDDHDRATTRTLPELRAWLCRLYPLLLQRQHSGAHSCAPAIHPYELLCDGTCIDEAHVRKTEQSCEASDHQPAAPR